MKFGFPKRSLLVLAILFLVFATAFVVEHVSQSQENKENIFQPENNPDRLNKDLGTWEEGKNWSQGHPPQADEDVVIPKDKIVQITETFKKDDKGNFTSKPAPKKVNSLTVEEGAIVFSELNEKEGDASVQIKAKKDIKIEGDVQGADTDLKAGGTIEITETGSVKTSPNGATKISGDQGVKIDGRITPSGRENTKSNDVRKFGRWKASVGRDGGSVTLSSEQGDVEIGDDAYIRTASGNPEVDRNTGQITPSNGGQITIKAPNGKVIGEDANVATGSSVNADKSSTDAPIVVTDSVDTLMSEAEALDKEAEALDKEAEALEKEAEAEGIEQEAAEKKQREASAKRDLAKEMSEEDGRFSANPRGGNPKKAADNRSDAGAARENAADAFDRAGDPERATQQREQGNKDFESAEDDATRATDDQATQAIPKETRRNHLNGKNCNSSRLKQKDLLKLPTKGIPKNASGDPIVINDLHITFVKEVLFSSIRGTKAGPKAKDAADPRFVKSDVGGKRSSTRNARNKVIGSSFDFTFNSFIKPKQFVPGQGIQVLWKIPAAKKCSEFKIKEVTWTSKGEPVKFNTEADDQGLLDPTKILDPRGDLATKFTKTPLGIEDQETYGYLDILSIDRSIQSVDANRATFSTQQSVDLAKQSTGQPQRGVAGNIQSTFLELELAVRKPIPTVIDSELTAYFFIIDVDGDVHTGVPDSLIPSIGGDFSVLVFPAFAGLSEFASLSIWNPESQSVERFNELVTFSFEQDRTKIRVTIDLDGVVDQLAQIGNVAFDSEAYDLAIFSWEVNDAFNERLPAPRDEGIADFAPEFRYHPAESEFSEIPPLPESPTLKVPGNFATIDAAILGAAPGDTIVVGPGTYRGDFSIDIPLTLKAERPGTVTLQGTRNGALAIGADDVTVEGITITGAGTGVFIFDASNVTLSNVTVQRNAGVGIFIDNSRNVSIENTTRSRASLCRTRPTCSSKAARLATTAKRGSTGAARRLPCATAASRAQGWIPAIASPRVLWCSTVLESRSWTTKLRTIKA